MKRIIQNGEVDWSDENWGNQKMLSEVEVNNFYKSLPKRQQIVLTYLMAGETWKNIGRFLGCSEDTILQDFRKIRSAWIAWSL